MATAFKNAAPTLCERKHILPGEYTSFGYRAVEVARENHQRIPLGGSSDRHMFWDRIQLLRESQAFDRDNGLYRGIVTRLIDNILGTGFTLQAMTSNSELNKKIEKKWRDEFCLNPEVRGLFPWQAVERAALRGLIVEGDFGAVKTNLKKIQMIESECIRANTVSGSLLPFIKKNVGDTNWVSQGVELNELWQPVAYYVDTYARMGYVKQQPRRIPADQFIFVANLERFSQTRGVPMMTSSFPMFHRVNDICDSEAVAWQCLSRLAIAVTRKDEALIANKLSEVDSGRNEGGKSEPRDRVEDFAEGTFFHGEPGEEIKGIDRNIPGPNFTACMTMFLRLLGLPIGIPLELLLLDWSHTNYSSARAALEQFFRMVTSFQEKMKFFESAVYEWRVGQWIADGEIENAPDVLAHDWITPSFPWIDQLKESQAWGERLDRGLTTHGEASKSVNKDRNDWLPVRQREIEEAIEIAEALNKKHPTANVDWRIFAGFKPLGTTSDMHSANGPDVKDPQAPDAKDAETPDAKDPQAPDVKEAA